MDEARIVRALADVATISTALRTFEIDCGRLPTTKEGLKALLKAPAGVQGWKGPYLERGIPRDPWGHNYAYRCPGLHKNDFDLSSYGPDGRKGGGDDIDNWSQK